MASTWSKALKRMARSPHRLAVKQLQVLQLSSERFFVTCQWEGSARSNFSPATRTLRRAATAPKDTAGRTLENQICCASECRPAARQNRYEEVALTGPVLGIRNSTNVPTCERTHVIDPPSALALALILAKPWPPLRAGSVVEPLSSIRITS
jgi:hypothetical protein